MKSETLSLKTIINELDILRKTVTDLLLLANRLIEKLTDPRNAKEHYQEHYQRKKNRKPVVKQSGTITYQPKTFENPKINDITIIYYNDKKQLSQNTQKLRINYPRL